MPYSLVLRSLENLHSPYDRFTKRRPRKAEHSVLLRDSANLDFVIGSFLAVFFSIALPLLGT
jgi:hypothetical protein